MVDPDLHVHRAEPIVEISRWIALRAAGAVGGRDEPDIVVQIDGHGVVRGRDAADRLGPELLRVGAGGLQIREELRRVEPPLGSPPTPSWLSVEPRLYFSQGLLVSAEAPGMPVTETQYVLPE